MFDRDRRTLDAVLNGPRVDGAVVIPSSTPIVFDQGVPSRAMPLQQQGAGLDRKRSRQPALIAG